MFFDHCRTLAELKAEYRRLALRHHPDKGGDTATMQAINAEHDRVFERLKAAQNAAADTDERTPHTDEQPEDFRRVLEVLLHLDGLSVELCGSWLWIGGDTYSHKDALKEAGCQWAPKKEKWYWHPAEERRARHHREFSMDRIREKYGSKILMEEEGRKIARTA